MHRVLDVVANVEVVVVHHAPALAWSMISRILDSLALLAFLVQATQAALITYFSVSPQALQGSPVYLRWPSRAASIRGDAT